MMTATGLFTLLYALVVIMGGVTGYLKAGSLISLLTGVCFGTLLTMSGVWIFQGSKRGLYYAFTLSSLLFIFFAVRYFYTFKWMPAGMMALLSFLVAIVVMLQKFRMDLEEG